MEFVNELNQVQNERVNKFSLHTSYTVRRLLACVIFVKRITVSLVAQKFDAMRV